MLDDLIRPRLAPLLAAIVTAGLGLGILEWVLTPDLFRDDRLGSLLVDRLGDNGYVAHAVVNAEKTLAPSVVFLGGSAARQLIDPSSMEKMLRAAIARDLRFLHLSAHDQTFSEDLLILDNLDLAPGSLIFVSVNPLRFYFSAETAAVEYRTPKKYLPDETTLRTLLADLGEPFEFRPRILRLSFLIREFLHLSRVKEHAERLASNVLAGTCAWSCVRSTIMSAVEVPPYAGSQFFPEEFRNDENSRRRKFVEARRGLFLAKQRISESRNYFVDVIRRVVALGRKKGATVVLIDLPNDPWLAASVPFPWAEYEELLAAVRGPDAAYLDLRRHPDFPDELFVDLIHVSTEGRRRFGPVFVDVVKRYLLESGPR